MLKILEKEADEAEKKKKNDDDDDDEDVLYKKQSGCIVKDGDIYNGYTVFMSKVDVKYGCYGMYNYYRMQVNFHIKHKTSKIRKYCMLALLLKHNVKSVIISKISTVLLFFSGIVKATTISTKRKFRFDKYLSSYF